MKLFVDLHWNETFSKLFLSKQMAAHWLKRKNENFGGTSPADLINAGRADKVLLWLKSVVEGN